MYVIGGALTSLSKMDMQKLGSPGKKASSLRQALNETSPEAQF